MERNVEEVDLEEVDNVEMELVVRHGLLPKQQSLGEEERKVEVDLEEVDLEEVYNLEVDNV